MTKPYWRLLERDEWLQEGDEYWVPVSLEWKPVREFKKAGVEVVYVIRRRVTPAPPAWIAVSSGKLPEPGQAFWEKLKAGGVCLNYGTSSPPQSLGCSGATHWIPAEIPAPPVPEPNEIERAFEQWKQSAGEFNRPSEGVSFEIFLAGFEAGRNGKP